MSVEETKTAGNGVDVVAADATTKETPVMEQSKAESVTERVPDMPAGDGKENSKSKKARDGKSSLPEGLEGTDEKGEKEKPAANFESAVNGVQLSALSEINTEKYLTVPKVREHTIARYKELMNDKVIFSQSFTTIDRQGTLYAFVGDGIRLKMTSKGIDGFYHNRKTFSKEEALSKTYNVMVTDVIEEDNLVYVSANAAKEKPRIKMRHLLDEGIESSVYKVVNAKVIGISTSNDPSSRKPKELCLLNIGGLGIMGSMVLADWSTCFTKSFYSVVAPGDIVKVAVVGKRTWASMEDQVYLCSRKLTLNPNPWKNIETALHVNDMVRVKCVDREEHNFFGKIEGFDEINAYCYYPEDPDYVIETGKTYIGKIARVNEKTKDLKVRFSNKF